MRLHDAPCGYIFIVSTTLSHNLKLVLVAKHRGVVGVITVLEVWVAAVTFLVMNGSNIQGLLGVNEIQAVLAS